MYLYHYSSKTREFTHKSQARLNPLETKKQKKNIYLKPANATFDKLPVLEDGKTPVYNSSWSNVVDNRGSKYFLLGDIKEYTIIKLGEDFPEGYLNAVDPVVEARKLADWANSRRYSLRLELQQDLTVAALGKDWDFSLESLTLFNGGITLGLPFPWCYLRDRNRRRIIIRADRKGLI